MPTRDAISKPARSNRSRRPRKRLGNTSTPRSSAGRESYAKPAFACRAEENGDAREFAKPARAQARAAIRLRRARRRHPVEEIDHSGVERVFGADDHEPVASHE